MKISVRGSINKGDGKNQSISKGLKKFCGSDSVDGLQQQEVVFASQRQGEYDSIHPPSPISTGLALGGTLAATPSAINGGFEDGAGSVCMKGSDVRTGPLSDEVMMEGDGPSDKVAADQQPKQQPQQQPTTTGKQVISDGNLTTGIDPVVKVHF